MRPHAHNRGNFCRRRVCPFRLRDLIKARLREGKTVAVLARNPVAHLALQNKGRHDNAAHPECQHPRRAGKNATACSRHSSSRARRSPTAKSLWPRGAQQRLVGGKIFPRREWGNDCISRSIIAGPPRRADAPQSKGAEGRRPHQYHT